MKRSILLLAVCLTLPVFAGKREDVHLLHTPGAVVDVRKGNADAPPEKLIRAYRPGTPGLFLIQFTAAPPRQWLSTVEALGWKLARYIPNNGFIAIGVPELARQTERLPFVQWVDFYHPYQKYALLAGDGADRALIFDLPAGPASEEAVEAIRAAARGPVRVHRGSVDTLVHATMNHGQAEKLLHQQLIIGVGPEPSASLSDERQVMALTSNVDGTETAPTTPGGYWSWVTSRCPNCASMPPADWKVGIADTGLDNGLQNGGHPDLAGRKYFGGNFSTSTTCASHGLQPHCGWLTHGTHVAGIIGAKGTGGTGFTDAAGYFLGQGVAPLAGIFSTRYHGETAAQPANVLQLTNDAAAAGVTVQNHSFNEYPASPNTSGTYSTLARTYDLAVRDADDDPSDGQTPLFISVAAGNNFSGSLSGQGRKYVIPGGTAKNVLSVSATEHAPLDPGIYCNTDGTGYRNIASFSRTETLIPGYIKPDVVAPAASIVLTYPSSIKSQTENFCENEVGGHPEYAMLSGTSFAAPVGAGAAILIKRYLGSTPGATSPALTKAMIIAGARSIRGGTDRSHFTTSTIGPAPNPRQGFGRISLDDILTGTTPPVTYDQASARLFTSTGQTQTARLKVRDGSKPVKVVLVWTDAAGTPSYDTNPLVNDLDLFIKPVGLEVTYLGNRLTVTNETRGEESTAYPQEQLLIPDSVNNVEYARFFGMTNAEVDVVINATRISGDVDGAAGFEQDFALVAVNADVVSALHMPLPPSTNVTATASGTTVTISWQDAANATGYKVERKTGAGAWVTAATVGNQTSATDAPGTADGVVLYRVRAITSTLESAPSNIDVAYAKTFTDETLHSGPLSWTKVRAEHLVELRKAVNALLAISGLAPAYSGDALDPAEVRDLRVAASDLTGLLQKMNDAREAAGLTEIAFSSAPAGSGKIRGYHIEELRDGVQ